MEKKEENPAQEQQTEDAGREILEEIVFGQTADDGEAQTEETGDMEKTAGSEAVKAAEKDRKQGFTGIKFIRRRAEGAEGHRPRRSSLLRILLCLVMVAAVMLAATGAYVVKKVDRVQRVKIDDDVILATISEEVKEEEETGTMKGYTNIALFGVDTRIGELRTGTRSDTIIIASINEDTGEIRLVSVYRDTYLNTGKGFYGKCNGAYNEGGPEQAIQMLNMNLDMNITDFVTVGFGALADTIDALGGLDIELTSAEIGHLNDYQRIMARQLRMEYIPVTQAGLQHLTGLQATAYCRIRYTSGGDYKRAERQRTVLSAMFEKMKHSSPAKLAEVADKVFDETYTSMTLTEILGKLAGIGGYSIAGQDGFPQEELRRGGMIGAKGSCIVPQGLTENVVWLHEFLFGDEDYTPSAAVYEISERIVSDTTPYFNGTRQRAEADETEPNYDLFLTDPVTGEFLLDPETGQPIPNPEIWLNQETGELILDPETGQPIIGTTDAAIGTLTGQPTGEPAAAAEPAAGGTDPAAAAAPAAEPAQGTEQPPGQQPAAGQIQPDSVMLLPADGEETGIGMGAP